MSAAKDSNALSELRHEYKSIKKELDHYDSFTDNHPFICIFAPFTLSIVVIIVTVVTSTLWAGWVALALFILSVVMLCVVLARAGKIAKINAKLDDIEHEVKLFHSKSVSDNTADGRSVSNRDELGLWQDINNGNSNDNNSGKGSWIMLIIVIIVVAAVGSMTQANTRNQEAAEREKQTQIMQQQQAEQQQDAIEQQRLDQQAEANRLQQQKNAIDIYNSSKPSSNNDYRSGTSCTSRAIGSTVYTDCD